MVASVLSSLPALSSQSHLTLAFLAACAILATSFLAFRLIPAFRNLILFAYVCFLQPLGKTTSQAERLDRFYERQAEVYDSTRTGLLRGRKTMLKLCAAQLSEMRKADPTRKLVWVDIGGGTGWNIEQMSDFFPLDQLEHIYLVDLCESLLQVARMRFERKGWKNVTVLCQDAATFTLPGLEEGRKVDLFTCSYSLSMIPPFYPTLDRINDMLEVSSGVLGVCDFYVAPKPHSSSRAAIVGGDVNRHCGWLSRLFWSTWFDLDHIDLHPARRDYLEHRFGTLKCYNGRNHFVLPGIVRIPYYIWLGCSREKDTSASVQAFEIEAGNRIVVPPSFPELSFAQRQQALSRRGSLLTSSSSSDLGSSTSVSRTVSVSRKNNGKSRRRGSDEERYSDSGSVKAIKLDMSLASSDIQTDFQLSSFHYQKRQWRLPFVDNHFADMFRTWIYGFTWEDPYVDMEHLQLGREDSILCITSAGDNALHYAIAAGPKRIHSVDMNPCQGHVLELKLACIASLEYEDFWKMFGEGRHERFRELLDAKISPYLSSHAYQFWRLNNRTFDSNFYFRGYSGWPLRIASWAFTLTGVRKDVNRMCEAKTTTEQLDIWKKSVRGSMINKTIIKFCCANPVFLWNALGVPLNQFEIFKREGVTPEDFIIDTLDPIPGRSLIKSENYHYKLCLQGKYSKESSPLYLKRSAFDKLKKNAAEALDSFRLHTDSIVNVLRGLEEGSLTHAVLMDHMDWFDPVPSDREMPSVADARQDERKEISDLDREVVELHRVVKSGGRVFWRSAAKKPWYIHRFEKAGFKVEPVHIRETGKPIDNVNMYASFYKAVRI